MSKLIKHQYSKSSLQNFMTVMLSITGLFVLYRYIKSIEKDSKIIQNYVLELESRVKNVEKNQMTVSNTVPPKLDNTNSVPDGNTNVDTVIVSDDDIDDIDDFDDDDDDESIGSEDITNLLKKVILGNVDMNETLPEVINEVIEVVDESESNEIETTNTKDDVVEYNKSDDITISYKTETQYKKMNLTELRTLLKDKGMDTKGSKSELVTRLLSC